MWFVCVFFCFLVSGTCANKAGAIGQYAVRAAPSEMPSMFSACKRGKASSVAAAEWRAQIATCLRAHQIRTSISCAMPSTAICSTVRERYKTAMVRAVSNTCEPSKAETSAAIAAVVAAMVFLSMVFDSPPTRLKAKSMCFLQIVASVASRYTSAISPKSVRPRVDDEVI